MTTIDLPLIRNSERSDFKTCPAKWNWRWNMGLVPTTPKQSAAWFGTQWHVLWATVYTPPGKDGLVRSITKPEEIHQLWDDLMKDAYTTIACAPYFDDDDQQTYEDAWALGHAMIDGQLKTYNLDPGYEVLMPEQRFNINIPYTKDQIKRDVPLRRAPIGKFIVKGVGTFDLPIRDHTDGRGRVWIVDWKTTNRKVNLKQANKDDQMGMYVAVSTAFLRSIGLLAGNEEVCGAMWSFAKKSMPPDPATVDDQGRKRNKPTKVHYVEVLTEFFGEDFDAKGLKIVDLETIAVNAGLKVWGDVSKLQGGPLFWREVVARNKANRIRTIQRIAEDAEQIQLVKAGSVPIAKHPGEHCNWCDFTDLCDVDEDGGDTETFIKSMYKYENPYMDHVEGAENSKLKDHVR